jgi:hypothetical protein
MTARAAAAHREDLTQGMKRLSSKELETSCFPGEELQAVLEHVETAEGSQSLHEAAEGLRHEVGRCRLTLSITN